MRGRVAVVGVGRIGLRIAWEASRLGFDIVLMDSRSGRLGEASRLVPGSESMLVDASNPAVLARALKDVDYAVVALPGTLGPVGVVAAVESGVDTVDISFYREIPLELAPKAEREGVRIFVDSGVAPGLSNMLVAMAARRLGEMTSAIILVGGVSREPSINPLGLAATWNAEDLVDEYIRPARILANGRIEALDPLSSACRVRLPRIGLMEAFPTDGLRSLLYTMRGQMERLVEYTLRHPGHLRVIETLRSLGLFEESPLHVDGCMVKPRSFAARIIERVTEGVEDMVVLAVKASSPNHGSIAYFSIVEPRDGWSAMARATGSFATATLAEALAGGLVGSPGLHFPEEIGLDGRATEKVLAYLSGEGVRVERVDPATVLVEECT